MGEVKMEMLILVMNIALASFNSVFLHKIPKEKSMITFNIISSAVWFLTLLSINHFSAELSLQTILWGMLYGLVQAGFLLFKAKAMNTGPVSLTTLIGNCSLVLSTVFSVIVLNETISIPQLFAMIALVCSFFLCTYTKGIGKANSMWIIYCICFFVLAASVGIIFKCYSKFQGQKNAGDMMIIASVVMIAIFSATKLFNRNGKRTEKFGTKYLLIAIVCGILSCVYNRVNIYLSGVLDASIFFPGFNGGVCILSLFLGVILFRERPSKIQATGLIAGTLAIITIGLF